MVFGSCGSVGWQDLFLVGTVISGCEAAVAFLIDPLRIGTQIRSNRTQEAHSEPELGVQCTPELTMPAAAIALNWKAASAGEILTTKTLHSAITCQPGWFFCFASCFYLLGELSASENKVRSLQCCLALSTDRTESSISAWYWAQAMGYVIFMFYCWLHQMFTENSLWSSPQLRHK